MANELIKLDISELEPIPEAQHEVEIIRGELYAKDNKSYRILDIRTDTIMVMCLDDDTITRADYRKFFEAVTAHHIIRLDDQPLVATNLSVEEIFEAQRRAAILDGYLNERYPNWERMFSHGRNPRIFTDMVNAMGLSARQTRRLLRQYLRSGRNTYSLVDQRHFNVYSRPDGELPEQKDTAVQQSPDVQTLLNYCYKVFQKKKSYVAAFDKMKRKFFMYTEIDESGKVVNKIVPDDQIPLSYITMYRYIHSKIGSLPITSYRKGVRANWNNDRMLPGDNLKDATRFGDIFEIDEQELPYKIIDEDTRETIGKSVVYTIVDVYTGIITGLYIGLANNSRFGFRQALLSMLEPHRNQTAEYGLEYPDHEFPSQTIPKLLRADQGSEYRSHDAVEICNELGCRLDLLPAAMGSFKGLVENCHHRIQRLFREAGIDNGYVNKDEYRAGDKSNAEACLTLRQVRGLIYRAVHYINTKPTNILLDREATEAKIDSSPSGRYLFDVSRHGDPRNVTPDNMLLYLYHIYARKVPRKFSFNKRKGIKYSKADLYYYTKEPWFEELLRSKKDRESIEVRYDDTDISRVLILYKKQVHVVPLSPDKKFQLSYEGITWDEFDDLINEMKAAQVTCSAQAYTEKLTLIDNMETEMSISKKLQGTSGKKYATVSGDARRANEKNLLKDQDEIHHRMMNELSGESSGSRELTEAETVDSMDYEQTDTHNLSAVSEFPDNPNDLSIEDYNKQLLKRLNPNNEDTT